MKDLWPWPHDTPAERARLIANSLLSLLPEEDRAEMTRRAHALGQTWLGQDLLAWDNDDEVPTATAARIVHVRPSTIRKWRSRGHLKAVAPGRYRVADVLDASARRLTAQRDR